MIRVESDSGVLSLSMIPVPQSKFSPSRIRGPPSRSWGWAEILAPSGICQGRARSRWGWASIGSSAKGPGSMWGEGVPPRKYTSLMHNSLSFANYLQVEEHSTAYRQNTKTQTNNRALIHSSISDGMVQITFLAKFHRWRRHRTSHQSPASHTTGSLESSVKAINKAFNGQLSTKCLAHGAVSRSGTVT